MSAVVCRHYLPAKKELVRKIIHIGTGPIIPLAWWLEIPSRLGIIVASLITIALIINHRLRILVALEEVNRQSYGTIAYGLSITFLFFVMWPENAAAATAGVLVMAFGDGLAGLLGRQFKSPTWRILNQKKSVIGTITMAIVTALVLTAITIICNYSISPFPIVAITSLGVILEQIGPWGIDNLTVPIGIAFSWMWIMS